MGLAGLAAMISVGPLMFAMAGAPSAGHALVAVAWRREVRLVMHGVAERPGVPSDPA